MSNLDPFACEFKPTSEELAKHHAAIAQKRQNQPQIKEGRIGGKKNKSRFFYIPEEWLKPIAPLLFGNELIAAIILFQRFAMNRYAPVVFSNHGLQEWGVSRHSKYRMMEKLEKAGEITVIRQGRCAPVINILKIRDHWKG